MAKVIFKNGLVRINGVDLSARADSVVVTMNSADVIVTAFQPTGGVVQHAQGLSADSFVIDFFQDWAAGQVDKTLGPLKTSGQEFEVKVAAAQAAISDTNPAYEGTCILLDYQPISGKVGDALKMSITFPSNTAIARVTT